MTPTLLSLTAVQRGPSEDNGIPLHNVLPVEVPINDLVDWVPVLRIENNKRPVTLLVKVKANGSAVDTLTDLLMGSVVIPGGDIVPRRTKADYGTADATLRDFSAVSAAGAAVDFKTTALGEDGLLLINWNGGERELVLMAKGSCTLVISGVIG